MAAPSDTAAPRLRALDAYQEGTAVWLKDEQEGWVGAVLVARVVDASLVTLTFEVDGGRTHTVRLPLQAVGSEAQLAASLAKELPPLRNPPNLDGIDDLTALSHLNEPAVLHNIRARYAQHNIYTYSGIVLIAANPFQKISLYSHDVVRAYSGKSREGLEPHLFAIAEDAYCCMARERKNQTIIVSGESGAGKTVSAKYIMRYLATAADHDRLGDGESPPVARTKKKVLSRKASNLSLPEDAIAEEMCAGKGVSGISEVEEQILATNPIMEAFGNAKTSRNDNSSRFGKYIEIEFDENQTIVGAKIRTYLLERTRLISQPESERNYHIFYQLVAGAPPSEKEELGLMGSAADFHYLNQGGADFQSIKGVDDAAEFAITQRALSTIGVAVQLQWQVFRLLSALLHVGNIKVGGSDKSPAFISESDVALETSARLLGLDAAALQKWLTMKQIITRSDKIVSGLSTAQAVTVRDALAKFVYSCVFEWLVEIVNSRLRVDKVSEAKKTFIGVLDIYGFEHFEKNSFEQFCINYANEKLQQGFAEHVFKLEQEEYVREQIEWTFIDFADNQRTIDMIEGKLGILSLLDEECRLPSGSDAGYLAKLYQNFETAAPKKTKTDGSSQDRQIFSKPRFSNSAFTIQHYAHPVTYEAEGFVEKNKDSVPEELLEILKGSQLGFLKDIIARREQQFTGPNTAADRSPKPQARLVARRPTLGSTFKTSLISLMNTIHTTNVHYIRCIKPNTTKQPWEFDAPMVLSQLRACGVLETIRISCAGYPSRWTISEFVGRFYMLVHSSIWARPEVLSDVRVFCKRILSAAFSAQTRDKYQIGVSRIFFRAGQVAYLERLRKSILDGHATVIQKHVRGYRWRTRHRKLRVATLIAQAYVRRKAAQKLLDSLRRKRAAITLQKHWRGHVARKRYSSVRRCILHAQAVYRGRQARKAYADFRRQKAAVAIQTAFRCWRFRFRFQEYRRAVVVCQSSIRRRNAVREFARLRAEARPAERIKDVSYHFENKVIELTHSLVKQQNANRVLTEQVARLEAAVRQHREKHEKQDARTRKVAEQFSSQLRELRGQLEGIVAEKRDLRARCDCLTEELGSRNAELSARDTEIGDLRQELKRQKEELAARNAAAATTPGGGSFRPPAVSARGHARKADAPGPDAAAVAAVTDEVSETDTQLAMVMRRRRSSGGFDGQAPRVPSRMSSKKYTVAELPPFVLDRGEEDNRDSDKENRVVDDIRRHERTVRRHTSTGDLHSRLHPAQRHTVHLAQENKGQPFSPVGGDAGAAGKRATVPGTTAARRSRQHAGLRVAWDLNNFAGQRAAARLPGIPPSVVADLSGDNPRARAVLIKLLSSPALATEIVDSLIKNLSIPLPNFKTGIPRCEVTFPAHLIGLCFLQMWKYRMRQEMQRLMLGVMKAIQKQTAMKDDDDFYCAFWLSNVLELLAIIHASEEAIEKSARGPSRGSYRPHHGGPQEHTEVTKLVASIKNDLHFLLEGIFHGWSRRLLKRLNRKVTPAVIEEQSLQGFVSVENGFLSKFVASPQPNVTVEGLLGFFTKILGTMECFFIDERIRRRVISAMLGLTGATAFNHLIMKKSLCSWRRGIQIQYNITKVEDWCQKHGMADAFAHLGPLMQAAKLLQLPKLTEDDVDMAFAVCDQLTPAQVNKLVSNYALADYEKPIPPAVLRAVAERSQGNGTVLLDTRQRTDLDAAEVEALLASLATRPIPLVERHVPGWVAGVLPNITAVVDWSARN